MYLVYSRVLNLTSKDLMKKHMRRADLEFRWRGDQTIDLGMRSCQKICSYMSSLLSTQWNQEASRCC
jgi:hypothetical protein